MTKKLIKELEKLDKQRIKREKKKKPRVDMYGVIYSRNRS